jgi:myo-inositol 2-dehydrogenase / D-chiro-inositol 1-dehydrogenase
MNLSRKNRREFLRAGLASIAGTALAPYVDAAAADAPAPPRSRNDRLRIAAIGMRYQGSVITEKALRHGDLIAVCDVDRHIAEQARASFGSTAVLYEDYRKMLERKDIDVVLIATPDHWHTAMAIAACQAGKDVYCEKPLTLTIDEGKLLAKVVKESKRVFQVGTWQRSDINFRLACELVRAGRLGSLRKVTVALDKNPRGGPFETGRAPSHLNWDMWQGQTPDVPYVPERCHYTFRWWQEYSGGKLTDWGTHHIDIAHWAMGAQLSGPVEIEGQATFPKVSSGYNVPLDYRARLLYAGGVEMIVRDDARNGHTSITFEGDKSSLTVGRGTLTGPAVAALRDDPLPRDKFRLYAHDSASSPSRTGKLAALVNHMEIFFDCVKNRNLQTISDVVSQHRSVSACHLVNIALGLGRKLRWDPDKETFVGDDEAKRRLARPQRKGYEIKA